MPFCPKCNQSFEESVERCPQCGADLAPPADSSPSPPKSRRPRILGVLGIVAALGVVAVGVLLCLRLRPHPIPEPEGLMPQNTLMAWTMDTPTLWKELSPMFQKPPLDQALRQLRQDGLDLEQDLFSWAGDTALCVNSLVPMPAASLLIRIRDEKAFAASWKRLRGTVEKQSGRKFQVKTYAGCPISTLSIPTGQGGMFFDLAIAPLKGYVAVGMGSAAVQEIVDVARGQKPSLASQKGFAAVRKELPPDPALLITIDYSQLLDLMPPQPGAPPPPAFLKSLGTVGVAVVEEPGRSRLEAVVLASTEEARSQFRRSAKLGSVRESTLAYFPETTLAVYLYHNLGGYWATMKENLKTMLPPQEAQKFESELMNPPALAGFDWQALVSELTGETGVALVNVEEKKAQVLVVAEAQEAPALTKSLQQLQKSLERVGFSWKKQEYQGTTLTVAAHPTFREAPVPLSPCYAQVDRTLLVASDAATLRAALDTAKGRGKSLREAPLYQTIRAQLPKQTQGLLFVDLRFLDRLFKQFAQAPEAGQVMAVLQSLGLNQVKAVGGGATLTENRGKQTLLVEGGNALHALVAPAAPVAAVLFPVFDQAREKARTAACQSNLKQIGLAALMLESDQGRLPDHRRLEQELQPYLRNPQVFQCPSARPGAPPYRMNSRVSRKALKQIAAPADTILAFESDEQGQPIFRHNDGINLLFVDGHVKWMKRGTLRDGQWTPQAGD